VLERKISGLGTLKRSYECSDGISTSVCSDGGISIGLRLEMSLMKACKSEEKEEMLIQKNTHVHPA
jgi:hypothetical protein